MKLGKVLQLSSVFLLFSLVGCAGLERWRLNGWEVGPNYSPPGAATANHWIDAGNPHLEIAPVASVRWWSVFDDPTLNRLIEAAMRQNLSLRVAALRILEARAQCGIAAGSLLPQKQEMLSQYARNQYSKNAYPFGAFPINFNFDDWQVGFDAAWELDIWGLFRRGVEAAGAALDAQVAGYDEGMVMLQAEVAANYVQMRSLEKRIALTQQNVDLQKKTLQLVELRYGKGLVTELDVQRAKANLAVTESLIPVFEINRRKAQNRLCILLGMPPHNLLPMLGDTGKIPQAPAEAVVGIPADLLRRRPDVRVAERKAAAQSARIGMAEADFYPHVAITGTIVFEAQDVSSLFKGSSIAGLVGPGFRWNLLNYGRIANHVDGETARFRQTVVEYQETVLKANEEAENAIVSFLHERNRAESLEAAATATEKAAQIAVLQYEKGLVDYQPVLDTERDLVRQQDGVAESRGQVAVNLVALYKSLGGGWKVRLERCGRPPAVESARRGDRSRTDGAVEEIPAPVPAAGWHTAPQH